MSKLSLIGIGCGDPDYLTGQAIKALLEVDVFFVVDKGGEKTDLVELRTEILRRHRPDGQFRTVKLEDPERDRNPGDYQAAVREWHHRRGVLYEEAIVNSLAIDECGAFLIWGDPALYDSTLRIIDEIVERNQVHLNLDVIPGISSVQVLASRHRIALNQIGGAIHITTGRRLSAGDIPGSGDLVIMLDSTCAFRSITFDANIYWGAYLGTHRELLIAGPVHEVGDEIERVRSEARKLYGWIMDVYLLRRNVTP